jgi:hypothetical protein
MMCVKFRVIIQKDILRVARFRTDVPWQDIEHTGQADNSRYDEFGIVDGSHSQKVVVDSTLRLYMMIRRELAREDKSDIYPDEGPLLTLGESDPAASSPQSSLPWRYEAFDQDPLSRE